MTTPEMIRLKTTIKRLTAIAVAASLCGCSAVPDRNMTATSAAASVDSTEPADTAEESRQDEVSTKQYPIENMEFSVKLNAEGGAFDGSVRTDGDFDGKGYIVLDEGMKLQHIVTPASSQHYCIAIAAHSYSGAVVRLKTVNEVVGAYYVPASDSTEFTMFAIDNVYLIAGADVLTFEVISGSAAMDYITVTNSTQVSSDVYDVAHACVGSSTAVSTLGLLSFFTDNYGKKVITGQCVSPGSNAEIDAITAETGRSPAMRTGDLMYSTAAVYESSKETADKEVSLALDWGRNGGIVSFGWHWYAPTGKPAYYADSTGFSLAEAVCDRDISMADDTELNVLLESGLLTEDTIALVHDIDSIAEVLTQFRAEGIPVVFQPLADGDSSMYWWSGDPESYKWLWKLVFDRLDKYYSLNNLIWVWNGSSEEYFPGEDYCDVIGQSFYEDSSSSFAGRFSALAAMTGETPKLLAVTACDRFPSPDLMNRDNALWLWFSIASGSAIIDNRGDLSERYNSWQSLHDAYNGTLCLTLDELPDFEEYAFQD